MKKPKRKVQSSPKKVARDVGIYIRLTPDDIKRLDALAAGIPVARFSRGFSRAGIAYASMMVGMSALEKDHAILMTDERA